MKYRINEIKLSLEEEISSIPDKIKEKAGARDFDIHSWKIVKESIDARKKGQIKKIYTVDFETDSSDLTERAKTQVKKSPDMEYESVPIKRKPENSPVIIGFGPCGMFAAYILSEMGMNPIVLERGSAMEKRVKEVETFWQTGILDKDSNVQFGEGGAGTFSDGKLTTGIKDPRIGKVLETFVSAGADEKILYKQKPHMGTDALRGIVVNLRKKIIENGGTVLFRTKATDLHIKDHKVQAVVVQQTEGEKTIERIISTENVILAIGHSARDTFRMIYDKGIDMEQKPFSIGVRIQHPQSLINLAQYKDSSAAEKIGPAEYKLNYKCSSGRGVYTFCMCPGGEVVVASSEEGGVVTNGMSYADRAGENANSALLVDVRTEDFGSEHPLAGIEFQRSYEKKAFINGGSCYRAPKAHGKIFLKEEKRQNRS